MVHLVLVYCKHVYTYSRNLCIFLVFFSVTHFPFTILCVSFSFCACAMHRIFVVCGLQKKERFHVKISVAAKSTYGEWTERLAADNNSKCYTFMLDYSTVTTHIFVYGIHLSWLSLATSPIFLLYHLFSCFNALLFASFYIACTLNDIP